MEITTPRSCIPQVAERKESTEPKIYETTFHIVHPTSCERKVMEGKYSKTKTCKTTFRIPHPAKSLILKSAQMRICNRKLNFLGEFMDRLGHPGPYQTGQFILQLIKMH